MNEARPALRLVPEPAVADEPRVLGAVELVPGRVRAAELSMTGQVLRRSEAVYAPTADRADVETALARAVAECFGDRRPRGVGVAAAGLVDPEQGRIIEVHDVPALHGYPVTEVLEGLTGARVHVEHRARLQVLGDRWFGPGRGRRSFASVSTGDVLGVGLLYEGQVVAPPGGRSGAHMAVAGRGRRCSCGARGCWKTVATTPWLRSRAASWGLGEGVSLRSLAASGEPAAQALVAAYAENLALGLVNIQQLFAPGLFVLHGEVRHGGERFREQIERRLRVDSTWTTGERPRVLVSEVSDDDVALRGGAGLVLTHG